MSKSAYSLPEIAAGTLSTAAMPFFFLYALTSKKLRQRLPERFSFGRWSSLKAEDSIWIHAASLGELQGVIPFLKELKTSKRIVITTTSITGREKAVSLPGVGFAELLPADQPSLMSRVVERISPGLFIGFETEIWPNLYSVLRHCGVPRVIINGRISDYSFPTYKRMQGFIKPFVEDLSLCLVQSQKDAERFESIGVPKGAIKVVGSTKYDSIEVELGDGPPTLRKDLGIPEDNLVLTAGSVRPGEAEILLAAFKELKKKFQNLSLLLVPRHPERFPVEANIIESSGYSLSRRSSPLPGSDVYLLDSLGELMKAYALADICFVGGTLVDIGGHNPMEAAVLSKPVIVGTFTGNVEDAVCDLIAAGGAVQVKDKIELQEALEKLVADSSEREKMGRSAREVVDRHRGASKRVLNEIERDPLLKERLS